MKRGIQPALLTAVLTLSLPVIASADINHGGGPPPPSLDVNKDFTNLGPGAYDLAIVLQGAETLTNHWDGYLSGDKVGWFTAPTTSTVGGNTVIHWQNFADGGNNVIDTNQTIHVGFSTADGTHKIVDIYWTDINGNRVPGSVVYDVATGQTYKSGRFDWTFANNFATAAPVSVTNIRYAVFSQPFPLGQLNSENTALASSLAPLSADLVLGPGEQRPVTVPVSVPAGSAVVIVYQTSAPGSGASLVNYVQTLAQ
jgi:hypothetical protein